MVDEVGGISRREQSEDPRVRPSTERNDLLFRCLGLWRIGAEKARNELIDGGGADVGSYEVRRPESAAYSMNEIARQETQDN